MDIREFYLKDPAQIKAREEYAKQIKAEEEAKGTGKPFILGGHHCFKCAVSYVPTEYLKKCPECGNPLIPQK